MSWTDIRHIIYNDTAALKTLFGTARSFWADLASVGWRRHGVSSRAFNQRWCLISPKMSRGADFSHPDNKFDHLFTPAGTRWQALSTEDLLFCFFQATGRAGVFIYLFFFHFGKWFRSMCVSHHVSQTKREYIWQDGEVCCKHTTHAWNVRSVHITEWLRVWNYKQETIMLILLWP